MQKILKVRTLLPGFLIAFLVAKFGGLVAYAGPIPVQPPSGIIAWWSLDETNGSTAADRLGHFPAAYVNSPVPAAGEVRGALRFTGNNYLSVQDSDSWAFGSNNFSIELWVNFDQAPGGSIGEPGDIFIGNDEGPDNRNKWFFATGGGDLYFHINSPTIGPRFFPLVPFSPTVGQWYHLAIVRSGSIYTIYTNGVAGGTATNSSVIPNPNAPLTIGEAEQIGFTRGRLDEITVYDRALTGAEVLSIYNAGSAGKGINLSILPNQGGDTGNVTCTINGTGFAQGATVSLAMAGKQTISGTNVVVGSAGTTISTTFNLTGVTDGAWDLVVTNPSGLTFTLPAGFTIEPGSALSLAISVEGLPVALVGRAEQYFIVVRNLGNVDVQSINVDSSVWAEENLDQSISSPQLMSQPTGLAVATTIPSLPAGQSTVISFPITIPVAGCNIIAASGLPTGSPPAPDDPDCSSYWNAVIAYLQNQITSVESAISRNMVILQQVIQELAQNPGDPDLEAKKEELEAAIAGLNQQLNQLQSRLQSAQASLANCSGQSGPDEQTSGLSPASPSSFYLTAPPVSGGIQVCTVSSFDPNDKAGPQGAGPLGYISGQSPLPYSIFFQNLPTATGPAQKVVITDQLDPAKVDLSTFSLGPISFGTNLLTPPPGQSSFATDVDLRPSANLIVSVNASLNPNTGLVTWSYMSIDPTTGNLPTNPLVGFLPPDVTPPQGEGSVLFTVMPRQGLATGTSITNNATIVFDGNPSLITGTWTNTIGLPVSIICPSDVFTNQAAGECSQVVSFAPIATGDPDPTLVCTLNGSPITSPFSFPVGTNFVTCTASNVSEIADCGFTVTVMDSTPPQAGSLQLGATMNTTASLPVPKLLAVATSPLGTQLSIVSVSSTSTNGGAVVLNGSMISYTSATNFVGQDQFTYTVSDGCDTAQGAVLVNVTSGNQQTLNLISITVSTSGTTLLFAGIPGQNYILQSAPTMIGPWSDLSSSITATATGVVQFTDTTNRMPPARFYRTRSVSGP